MPILSFKKRQHNRLIHVKGSRQEATEISSSSNNSGVILRPAERLSLNFTSRKESRSTKKMLQNSIRQSIMSLARRQANL